MILALDPNDLFLNEDRIVANAQTTAPAVIPNKDGHRFPGPGNSPVTHSVRDQTVTDAITAARAARLSVLGE